MRCEDCCTIKQLFPELESHSQYEIQYHRRLLVCTNCSSPLNDILNVNCYGETRRREQQIIMNITSAPLRRVIIGEILSRCLSRQIKFIFASEIFSINSIVRIAGDFVKYYTSICFPRTQFLHQLDVRINFSHRPLPIISLGGVCFSFYS